MHRLQELNLKREQRILKLEKYNLKYMKVIIPDNFLSLNYFNLINFSSLSFFVKNGKKKKNNKFALNYQIYGSTIRFEYFEVFFF